MLQLVWIIYKKIDDLDVGNLKAVPADLKEISDVVDNEVAKNTNFNTLNTKVNNLEKKTRVATTLIHINQCNTDKQNLEKKIADADKKNSKYKWFSVCNCFEYKY